MRFFPALNTTIFLCALMGHSYGAIAPQGGEFPLVGDIAGHQQYPSVALHRAGGLVAWQNATAESGGERVVVQALGAPMPR